MIPIGDNLRLRRVPVVTFSLIALNAGIFMLQMGMPVEEAVPLYRRLGVIPPRMLSAWSAVLQDPGLLWGGAPEFFLVAVMPLITSMFLHGGPVHLAGNMLYLWIFGDDVEDRLGRGRFLAFYLCCGIASAWVHVFMEPAADVPVVGASGAIAGVLGAYMLLFPKARILVLVPIVIFITILQVSAFVLLAVWFVMQLPVVHGIFALGSVGTIAYWAHVGGFLAGLLLLPLALLGARPGREAG